MKKIVLISETLEFGVRDHLIGLMTHFIGKSEVKLFLICGTSRVDKEILHFLNAHVEIKVYKVPSLKRKISFDDYRSYQQIKKILLDISPDIVHCHSSKAGFSGRIAAKKAKCKHVYYSPHGYYFLNTYNHQLSNFLYKIAEKVLASKFTDMTILTSIGELDCFKENKIDSINKSILIENGIKASDNTYEILKERNGEKVIVSWMGRFSPQKNPELMIQIAKKTIDMNPNFYFHIAGDGELFEDIKYNIENSEYSENIKLFGKIDYPNEFLSTSNIFLTTSLYEGLPYTLIMVLSFGVPIVATNVVGNSDCVTHGVNGYLYESGDIESAVKHLLRLSSDIDRIKLGIQSKKIFEDRFEYKKMMKKYDQLYSIRQE